MLHQRPPINDVFAALDEYGIAGLRQVFTPRCCVAGTRLVTTVLRNAGYRATAQPTWCRAGNAGFVKGAMEEASPERMRDLGARWVEIDAEHTGTEYPAHLVAISEGWLVDITASQFRRPAKAINVPDAVAIRVPTPWTAGIGANLPGGGAIVYQPAAPEMDYRTAPDWRYRERTDPIAAAVLLALGVTTMVA